MTHVASRLPDTEQAAEPEPQAGAAGQAGPADRDDDSEPDARFTFANERTFLAWNRTALALVVAGLAIAQLLPPFPGLPFGRHLLAVPLIALGAILSVAGYLEWRRNQRALRHGQPLPRSPLPRILAASITAMAIIATVLVLLSAALK
jgi:putative membrane protein